MPAVIVRAACFAIIVGVLLDELLYLFVVSFSILALVVVANFGLVYNESVSRSLPTLPSAALWRWSANEAMIIF